MKKYCIMAVIVAAALVLSVEAFAVPTGRTVVLEPKGAGKVVFDGKLHAEKGFKCADCHQGVFMMKKGGDKITMKDIREGKFCGDLPQQHQGIRDYGRRQLQQVPQELSCLGIRQDPSWTSMRVFLTLPGRLRERTVCTSVLTAPGLFGTMLRCFATISAGGPHA